MRYPAVEQNWLAPIAEPSTLETDMLPYIGQLNPVHDRRFMRQRGRMLSGLGNHEVPGVSTVDPTEAARPVHMMPQRTIDDASGEIQYCEEEDDVEGSSGIFDSPMRRPNINPNMGVFSAQYNVPGFISREKLFAPNKSLFDSPNGGDVVVIPGGGGLYIDPASIPGEFSQPFGPPESRQAAPPSSFQPQSYWWPMEYPTVTQGPTLTNPYAPPSTLLEPLSPIDYGPATLPVGPGPGMEAQPFMPAQPEAPMPTAQPFRPAGGGAAGTVGRPFIPQRPAPRQAPPRPLRVGAPAAALAPRGGRVRLPSAAMNVQRQQKLAGLGQEPSGPSTATVVIAGAIVGAGLAMIYKAVKG